jgi:hypothetical protein
MTCSSSNSSSSNSAGVASDVRTLGGAAQLKAQAGSLALQQEAALLPYSASYSNVAAQGLVLCVTLQAATGAHLGRRAAWSARRRHAPASSKQTRVSYASEVSMMGTACACCCCYCSELMLLLCQLHTPAKAAPDKSHICLIVGGDLQAGKPVRGLVFQGYVKGCPQQVRCHGDSRLALVTRS